MLQDIRDNSQGIIAKIIIGLIVAVFALFGVESIIGGLVTSPPVAEVNGEEITEVQLQNSTQNLMNQIGASGQGIDQALVEQLALNQLIEESILRQRAAEANMTVSSDRIDQAILENPQFQVSGRFDTDLAVRTMATQGFSVPMYRGELARGMLLGQLVNAFSSSNFVTDAELQRVAELTRETRDFRFVSIPMGTRTLDTQISDAEIQAYYDNNQEEFREPETVAVSYVTLDQDVIADEIEVPEAQISARYEQELDAFEGASERRAAHILIEVSGDVSEEDALAQAEAARQRLDAGEEFAELALEFSSDTVSAEQGGDIGYTDGSAFPQAIEEALDELALNEVSGPVVTEFGVHLVKLTEAADQQFATFEEARERIERELKSAEVDLLYGERLETLSNLAFESADLQPLSERLGLEIQTSEPTPRTGGSGLFANQQLVSAAWSDQVFLDGNNSDVLELSDTRAVVLRVAEYNEATVPPLAEVRPQIAVLLRAEMEREAVQELGNELLSRVQAGEDVDEFIVEHELEWISREDVSRNATVANREVINTAFSLPIPEGEPERSTLTLPNGTFVLVELTEVTPGSLLALSDEERLAIKNRMADDLGNSDFDAYLGTLRSRADIEQRERFREEF
ncbi:MAG: SurA N-terminal domain-containing protein [Pseudohongiellaceae bacterium]